MEEKPKQTFVSSWELSPALENPSAAAIQPSYDLFIDGKWQPPSEGKYFPSINPSNQAQLSLIAYATTSDVNKAVQAAQKAYDTTWSKLSGKERGKYLFRIARIIQERAKELALAETIDGGKPIRASRENDIPLAANHFFYYAGWTDKLAYAFPNRRVAPIGVVAQIIPWNSPLLMAAWKIAPALAAGNTVVLKPAETTSLTALKLAEIFAEAGLPAGVVNIITGDEKTGNELVQHPGIKKIAFSGSSALGKNIQQLIAGSGKKISLALGGQSTTIIFEDAPIDQAVEGIIQGIFFHQSQVGDGGSHLYLQESCAEEVIRKLKSRIATLIVGNPLDNNTDIGVVHSQAHYERIRTYIELGKAEGNECFESTCTLPSEGNYIVPTLFFHVAQSSRLVQDAIVGPVMTVQTFRTIEEVLQKANNSSDGLAAGIWTDKGSKAIHVAQHLKTGANWINTYNQFDPTSPFGGYKESGIGREGGMQGLANYVILTA